MNDSSPRLPGFAWPGVLLNLFFLSAGLAAVFFLLTGGIPFEQWNLVRSGTATKAFCMKSVRASVLVFGIPLIVLAAGWPGLKKKLWVAQWAQRIFEWPLRRTVAMAAAIYSLMMTAVGFQRHAAMDTRAFDLGVFAQALWNTTRGDFLVSSLKGGICLLGDHVSPILVLLVPFYAFWSDPRVLLVVQPLATASCLFAVAWIAFDRFRDKKTALLFVLMFFFYLPARAALREDFHPEVVAEIFIFLAFIALERKKMRWFWVCVIPVMAAKENFLGVTFFLGGYAFGFKGRRKTGAVLMALSAALFLFEIRWVAPFFSKAPYFYGTNYALSSAEHGRSVLADPKRWEYLLKVYATFLFVPLFHLPTALLTVPICAQNFFAANPVLRSPNYHYSAGLTPFLFISTIYGLKVLCGTWRPLARYRNVVAGVLLIVILTQSGPPEYFYFWQCGHRRNAHTELVRRRLAGIDPARSVLTHNNFIPQLINRRWVYQLEYNPTPTKGELARRLGVDYVIVDEAFWEPKSAAPPEALADLRAAGYDTEFEKEGFFVLKRKG